MRGSATVIEEGSEQSVMGRTKLSYSEPFFLPGVEQ